MFREVIKLLSVDLDAKTDLGGREPKIVSEKELFANKESVRQTEFYQAMQAGLETQAIFSIWSHEYDEERVLVHDNKYFTIVRTYEKGDYVHLTCTKRRGVFDEAVR